MQSWNAYIIWAVICGLGLLLSLAGEYRSNSGFSGLGKLVAASAYIAAALSLGAVGTEYGRVLLVGMAFCWLGDSLLASKNRQNLFLAGLVSFLLGHLVYIGAFTVRGISFPALVGAAVVMAVFAWRLIFLIDLRSKLQCQACPIFPGRGATRFSQKIEIFPVFSQDNREFWDGDGFAADCTHRQIMPGVFRSHGLHLIPAV